MYGERATNPVPRGSTFVGAAGQRRRLARVMSPVPAPFGRVGWCASRRGCRRAWTAEDVSAFLADLDTHRDRAIVLAMVLGGLRAAEVRALRLADVDMGLRRVRVIGKGDRERRRPDRRRRSSPSAPPICASERPPGCPTAECFVVLRGPTAGQADDRGRDAQGVPHPPGTVGSDTGAAASAPSHLWRPSWPRPGSTCWRCGS